MEVDPQVLLALIALRLRSGRQVPAADEPFKTLKKAVARAKELGLVADRKADVMVVGKSGKAAKKNVAVLDLTPAGESEFQRLTTADVQAAIAARQQSAVLQALEADRVTLRQEVLAALSAKSKAKAGDANKAIADVAKTVQQLADRLAKLESAMQSGPDNALVARIDQAFAALQHKLTGVVATGSPQRATVQGGPAAPSVAESLRHAYRTLRQFHEFSDGLVPIPRLYHEARRALPSLSVEALHRELQALWDRRELELKILNEVRLATEPDKAIHRGDNLYYYVYWASP